jgi:hypothetical protein
MDYGAVLTRAGKIIWKFKILWVFGILASCGQGGGGGGGGSGSGSTNYQFSPEEGNLPPGVQDFFNGVGNFFENLEPLVIVLAILGIILFFMLIWLITTALNTIGRLGLIHGALEAEEGAESLSFGGLFNRGKPFFWRVVGLNIVLGLAVFFAVLILIVPIIGVTLLTFGIGLLCLLPVICLLVPVGALASIVIEQANLALVTEDLGIVDSVKRGWQVFRANLGSMIVMALILVIGGWVVNFIIALPLILLIFPVLIGVIGGTVAESAGLFAGGIATGLICGLAYSPILLVLSGIVRGYIQVTWTLTYKQLTGDVPAIVDVGGDDSNDGNDGE